MQGPLHRLPPSSESDEEEADASASADVGLAIILIAFLNPRLLKVESELEDATPEG